MKILCSKCSSEVHQGTLGPCPVCGSILRPEYPQESINQLTQIELEPGIDRYRPVLPVSKSIPFLGEGDTPLTRSRSIGPALGLKNLYLKNEGRNPSGSFKDRPGALASALALEAEAKGVLTASSGNAATAISAYAASTGLECLILLEPGNPPAKLRQALATGAKVLPVRGIFSHGPEALRDKLIEIAVSLNYYLAFVWAPVNPYLLEGIKTISYELVARLGNIPDVVICPVGGGDMITAQWRGYLEMKRAGMIKKLPRMIAVQSVNAPPLLHAFQMGDDRVNPLPYANSKISGINVPFTGDHALAAVHESGGFVIGVQDEAAFSMQHRIGVEEGIWVEPASAAPLASLSDLIAQGVIYREDQIVCILSGAGFKDTHLAEKEALAISHSEPLEFDFKVEEIEAFLKRQEKNG